MENNATSSLQQQYAIRGIVLLLIAIFIVGPIISWVDSLSYTTGSFWLPKLGVVALIALCGYFCYREERKWGKAK